MTDLTDYGRNSGPPNPKAHRPLGVVSNAELYTLSEAKIRLGWTDSAFRAAKRRGLRLLACGKRRYVSCAEIIRFLESLPPVV
jgi:hypothetical protein